MKMHKTKIHQATSQANVSTCYNNPFWNLHHHARMRGAFWEALLQVSIWWCYFEFFGDPHPLTDALGVLHLILDPADFCHVGSRQRGKRPSHSAEEKVRAKDD